MYKLDIMEEAWPVPIWIGCMASHMTMNPMMTTKRLKRITQRLMNWAAKPRFARMRDTEGSTMTVISDAPIPRATRIQTTSWRRYFRTSEVYWYIRFSLEKAIRFNRKERKQNQIPGIDIRMRAVLSIFACCICSGFSASVLETGGVAVAISFWSCCKSDGALDNVSGMRYTSKTSTDTSLCVRSDPNFMSLRSWLSLWRRWDVHRSAIPAGSSLLLAGEWVMSTLLPLYIISCVR